MLPIAFLGVCDGSTGFPEGHEVLWRQDLLGLRRHMASPVYPWSLGGMQFVFAVFGPPWQDRIRVALRSPTGDEVMWMNLGLLVGEEAATAKTAMGVAPRPGSPETVLNAPRLLREQTGWFVATAVPPRDSVAWVPGCYVVEATCGDSTEPIGYLDCLVLRPAPLSPDRIAAIRANPLGIKVIRFDLKCKECPSTLSMYAALEKKEGQGEFNGITWYEDLPDEFGCSCGKTRVDLSLMKSNLHGLLGLPSHQNGEVSLVPRYHRAALDRVAHGFSELLESDAAEEELQRYLEANPVILSQFSPDRMWFKAPILTKYKTDIVVLNHKKELLLIELEKPTKRLLKKDGGIAAELQHAVDQVYDWLNEAEEYREAVLSCIGLKRNDVARIRAMVVAGRERGCDAEALRKLKKRDFGQVEVVTFDDLLAGFAGVLRAVGD